MTFKLKRIEINQTSLLIWKDKLLPNDIQAKNNNLKSTKLVY